jgi:3-oxoacyl-[acyl-carrier-protein] synthase II
MAGPFPSQADGRSISDISHARIGLMSMHTARDPQQRVVITGMGAITPVGNSVKETWDALKAGRSGIERVTSFDADAWPCQIGGEVKGFDPRAHFPRETIRMMSPASQLAVVAAGQALQDAALDIQSVDGDRVGVVIGTAGGSTIQETEEGARRLVGQSGGKVSPLRALRVWPNMPAYFVAQTFRIRGYNSTVCTACAAATQAIGDAAEVIRRGEAEVMLAGGAESVISPMVLAGFCAMHALATSYNDQPHRAMRPFDADREGFVAGQGSALLLLESLDHALRRGARIHAEILGYGVSNDGFHIIEPDPRGTGAALAIRRALQSAGIGVDQIDYINAHGTSTPLGDAAETLAIKSVMGERAYRIPISSTKSMIGHAMGAAGAIEAVACVMTLREGLIHPTLNYETPDPACDLDYVPNTPRRADVRVALSNSFGLGGQNAVLVLGAYADNA